MKLTYEALLADPKLMGELLATARRERALAVQRYLIAPVARWFARAPSLERHQLQRRSAYC